MNDEKSENLWKLVKEKVLETDINLNHDFNKSIIQTANEPCSYRYCSECIMKFDPGILEYSHDDMRKFYKNILSDQSSFIKCIENNPKSTDNLQNNDNDFKKSVNCSFSRICCHGHRFISQEIQDHLMNENYSHCNLLIEWINNITNEIESLNKEIKGLKTEIKFLKEENEIFKKEKSQLLVNKLSSKQDKQEIINFKQANSINKINQIEPNIEMNEIIQLISDMSSILNQLDEVCKEFDQMKQTQTEEGENLTKNLTELDRKQRFLFSKLNETNQNIAILIGKSRQIDEAIKILDNRTRHHDEKLRNLEKSLDRHNYGYFIWNIERFSDKMKNAQNWTNPVFYSQPFYTHKYGYKLRLCVYPDGNSDAKGVYLSIYFCIVRGQFDNILSWPIKPSVTIELINQQTGQVHVSKTAEYENDPSSESWKKPISEKNNGLGFCKFIKQEDLKKIPELLYDDQIFIKCSVNLEL